MTKKQIKTHEDFVLSANGTEGTVWPDTTKIVVKDFPDAVAKGMLSLGEIPQISRRRIDRNKPRGCLG